MLKQYFLLIHATYLVSNKSNRMFVKLTCPLNIFFVEKKNEHILLFLHLDRLLLYITKLKNASMLVWTNVPYKLNIFQV